MKHSVIGWNAWDVTEEGIKKVYNSLIEAGSSIDRFGICCDWIMGVPEEYRDKFQAGGSLIFNSPEEWKRIGQVVPVNPHLGDHMIGSLNGVDTEHAGEIAAVLKAIGPEQLEINFGSGLRDKESMRGRVPIRPTSIVQTINHIRDEALSKIDVSDKGPLDGIKVVVGSTDVHEFGKEVVRNVISKAGATVFDLGTTVSIPEVADTLVETGSNILCMSTYNGMAYGYARDLVESLDKAGLGDTHIIMGGRLNEPLDGSDVPIDCSDRLAKMGINVDNDVDTMVDTIKKMAEGDK